MPPPLSYDAARHTGIESSQYTEPDIPARRRTPPPRTSTRTTSLQPARLQKPLPDPRQHARASSGQHPPPNGSQAPRPDNFNHPQGHLNVPGSRASLDMGTVPLRNPGYDGARPMTPNSAPGSRPTTPVYTTSRIVPPTPPSSNGSENKKKQGWFGKKKEKHEQQTPLAWIAGHADKPAYDIHGLMQGRIATELWNNNSGDCYIHLFPPNFDKEASFKVNSSIFEASPALTKLVVGDGRSTERHVYLQLRLSHAAVIHGSSHSTSEPTPEDLQILVDYRNLFAFLCGHSLVATEQRSTLLSIFNAIASLLRAYEFSSADSSTFGAVADASFNNYIDELGLADVRSSREKTIHGIVLGERMKSATLYHEAFTHAVGKLSDIITLDSPKFDMITPATKIRLSRAALDLEKRIHAAQLILTDFDFPSIFSGIMNSKTAAERKEGVRFDAWKDAFFNTRKWMLATLKQQYGDWPPKAKSKKNDLEVSGLQRQVLRPLYQDLCSMYDLLVDRTQLTTRTVDGIDRAGPVEAPWIRALRSVLSEYDRSSPPVKPPVPFDLPRLPALATARLATKSATTKLKDDEIATILRATYNEEVILTPFLNAFRDMERRAAHGCTLQEIIDLRTGQWIFMYAVMQALPMLACDAAGLKFKKNVEYFLCEPPRDGMPWCDPQKAVHQKKWFSVGDAGSVVSLPAHVVEHSTEGIYRRSHCWEMAEKWAAANPLLDQALHEQNATTNNPAVDNLPLPRYGHRSRSASPARSYRNSSLSLGLEVLSLAPGTTPMESRKSTETSVTHVVDSNKTFDAIFATMESSKTSKKKAVLTK